MSKYKIKMMDKDTFIVSEETFKKLAGQSGLVYIKEIGVTINLNSITSIAPLELDNNRRVLSDGTRVIKKFNSWVLEDDNSVKIDLLYYPELVDLEGYEKKEIEEPSKFAKELKDKF